jgi:hypothetical protein
MRIYSNAVMYSFSIICIYIISWTEYHDSLFTTAISRQYRGLRKTGGHRKCDNSYHLAKIR